MKLHSSLKALLKPGKRKEVSASTRFLDFPWGSQVGWPLREIGVHVTGIDYLDGHYLGGTEASTTHLLYFVLKGDVECHYGENYKPLTAGHWVVCPAQGPHWIRHVQGKTEALWVHLLDTPRWLFIRNNPGIFPICHPGILRDSLIHAIHEAENREYGAFESATAHTTIFRISLIREIDQAFDRNQSSIRSQLADLWAQVDSHLEEAWTVERMAAELHMSISSFYQQVTRHHGLKPMQMVTQLRMERAKDLLLHSNEKLETIANAVGYETAYSFSDAFHRQVGLRPGQFRKIAHRE